MIKNESADLAFEDGIIRSPSDHKGIVVDFTLTWNVFCFNLNLNAALRIKLLKKFN